MLLQMVIPYVIVVCSEKYSIPSIRGH